MKTEISAIFLLICLALTCASLFSCTQRVQNGENTDTTADSVFEYTDTYTETAALPGTSASDVRTIGGIPIEEFTIVYADHAIDGEGRSAAMELRSVIRDTLGITLGINSDLPINEVKEHEILFGAPERPGVADVCSAVLGTYGYRIELKNGKLFVAAGCEYGLKYCAQNFLSLLDGISENSPVTGSRIDKELFPRTEGAELRIMSNNVWNCDSNRKEWSDIGENCSASVRSYGFAAVYTAYYPDVIGFQEMSYNMINFIKKKLRDAGCEYTHLTYTTGSANPCTSLLYRSDRLNLLEQGHHDFDYKNDSKSKGYTWGYFEMKDSGKRFIVLSTHLWWKSESAENGSDAAREMQASEIVTETNRLIAEYGCPVFVIGDFNTTTTSNAFKVFTKAGFADTFNLATVYADNNRGYHYCKPEGFARETANEPYEGKAIDHIILKNSCGTKVLTFDHARPYFYIKLSDHYPLYVDVVLGNK
ncbi:MAG: endonuclease/exonuclease/phosphatase family protein [Clostridia bacterium]|nr:endonuclease/exonuclease/phosphatase family protein [Clostridia bacterium]